MNRSFSFFMGVSYDFSLATTRIKEIRDIYPDVPIICCDELGVDFGFNSVCIEHDVLYFNGGQIKELKFGGEWCERMLLAFLSYSQSELLIRIEPDTKILRQFSHFPDAELFGSLRSGGRFNYLQGGCLGIARDACELLAHSDVLQDSLYSTAPFGYFRFQPPYLQPGETRSSKQLAATDLILTHAASRFGLTIGQWDDVCCHTFKSSLEQDLNGLSSEEIRLKYAALHPCKTD